jgi:hypothetical protein
MPTGSPELPFRSAHRCLQGTSRSQLAWMLSRKFPAVRVDAPDSLIAGERWGGRDVPGVEAAEWEVLRDGIELSTLLN